MTNSSFRTLKTVEEAAEQKEETVEESEEELQPQEANQEDESPVIESIGY